MHRRPAHCPDPDCRYGQPETAPPDFFTHKGSYQTKHDRLAVPRYRCRACKKTFSSRQSDATAGQHKPHVNEQLAKLLSSGVTQRRAAKLLGIDKVTVARKFVWLAERARQAHAAALADGRLKTGYVQFDEMETFEHSKLKPLSIALAVRHKTGEIIGARVAVMNCHGKTAALSQKIYGLRADTRRFACKDVMECVKLVAKPKITIASDQKTAYATYILAALPHATHRAHLGRAKARNAHDPLFRLNHTAAKIRADLSRMARRTWSTTKRAERLQDHLDIYIAYNNGYDLS
jgi:hypothetical protein